MKKARQERTLLRECGVLLVLIVYVCAVAVWTPIYLLLPLPIPGLTYRETLACRWGLVRYLWLNIASWFR